MGHNIPSPPHDGHDRVNSKSSRKSSSSSKSSKSSKSSHRASKRIGTSGVISAATSHAEPHSPGASDGRHKRVWKACERCRMKKTKCDGEFPCKRCKDDGLICTAGVRKKVEYKQLPRGYAEVLESTQFALIATIHKLYSMVQNGERWELGDPEVNDRGLPVVHNIAHKLGCIRPNSDIDLPVHSVFPEDERDLQELVRQLEAQQHDPEVTHRSMSTATTTTSTRGGHLTPGSNATDVGSMSDHDHSDIEEDHRGAAGVLLSPPQSLPAYNDFDASPDVDHSSASLFPDATMTGYGAPWDAPSMMPNFFANPNPGMTNQGMMGQGLLDAEFARGRTQLGYHGTGVMLGMGDPMMYSGFDDDDTQQLRL